jgi:hypothetical protein
MPPSSPPKRKSQFTFNDRAVHVYIHEVVLVLAELGLSAAVVLQLELQSFVPGRGAMLFLRLLPQLLAQLLVLQLLALQLVLAVCERSLVSLEV